LILLNNGRLGSEVIRIVHLDPVRSRQNHSEVEAPLREVVEYVEYVCHAGRLDGGVRPYPMEQTRKAKIATELENICKLLPPQGSRPSRLAPLLRFLVKETLEEGVTSEKSVTDSVIANELFPQGSTDNARQAVGRLRLKLDKRYRSDEGRSAAVRFSIPEGGYRVCFEFREVERLPGADATPMAQQISSMDQFLLEVVNQQVRAGRIDEVRRLLARGSVLGIADNNSSLAMADGCVARVTGDERAEQILTRVILANGEWAWTARLELYLLRFARGASLDTASDGIFDKMAPGSELHRSCRSLIALSYLREKQYSKADKALLEASPEQITRTPIALYRAIPMGLACLATKRPELAERHLDLVRPAFFPIQECCPFVSIAHEFHQAFVDSIVGRRSPGLSEDFIRRFKGHAWVIMEYADFLSRNQIAVESLVKLSSAQTWDQPIREDDLFSNLNALKARLEASAGIPPWSEV
jgi:hypothetical protein